jgi:hypothetical protein
MINIGYGHMSVQDDTNGLIYFHGGLTINAAALSHAGGQHGSGGRQWAPTLLHHVLFDLYTDGDLFVSSKSSHSTHTSTSANPRLSSSLYVFNVNSFGFRSLPSSHSGLYASAMSLYKSCLFVYGGIGIGNGHSIGASAASSSTSSSTPLSEHVSNKLLMFDLVETKWTSVQEENSKFSMTHRQRYGHGSFIHDEHFYVHAGFNGFFLGDLFKVDLRQVKLFEMEIEKSKNGSNNRGLRQPPSPSSLNEWPYIGSIRRRRQSDLNESAGSWLEDDLDVKSESESERGSLIENLEHESESDPIAPLLEAKHEQQQKQIYYLKLVEACGSHASCRSCHTDINCVWNEKRCEYYTSLQSISSLTLSGSGISRAPASIYSKPNCTLMCADYDTCMSCLSSTHHSPMFNYGSAASASAAAAGYSSTIGECVWCSTQQKCILRKATHVHYPFGECLSYASEREQCESPHRSTLGLSLNLSLNLSLMSVSQSVPLQQIPPSSMTTATAPTPAAAAAAAAASVLATPCSTYYTNCSSCIRDERCGWCSHDASLELESSVEWLLHDLLADDRLFNTSALNAALSVAVDAAAAWSNRTLALNTGLGICMEGGTAGSLGNRCIQNWYFSYCPACECNGHSTCTNEDNTVLDESLKALLHLNSSGLSYLNGDSAKANNNAVKVNGDSVNAATVNASSIMQQQRWRLLELLRRRRTSWSCGTCLNNTQGEYCSQCKRGYFGNARNNGTCVPCDCGQQAASCEATSGRCHCMTKGVVGSRCDVCETPKYTGRPTLLEGSCFYNLTTDYQFTFNLNKESDRHYTRINFVNHPTRGTDDDIDFIIRCLRENALINVTFVEEYNQFDAELEQLDASPGTAEVGYLYDETSRLQLVVLSPSATNRRNGTTSASYGFARNLTTVTTSRSSSAPSTINYGHGYGYGSNSPMHASYNYYFGPISNQYAILTQINCTSTEFKFTFSNREFGYANKNVNSTFVVYVYDFQTPITIQVAFSRRSRIQLLHFFITFFGCLLSLLAIAFITWKSKQRYDRYRRQRQIMLQMEQMASRPFATLMIDVTDEHYSKMPKLSYDQTQNMAYVHEEAAIARAAATKASTSRLNDSKLSPTINNNNNTQKGSLSRRDDSSEAEADTEMTVVSPGPSISKLVERVPSFKIMPVAVEPFSNNKTAIVTCLMRLPQGGLGTTPKGTSPLVLASSHVQVSSSSPFMNVASNNANSVSDGSSNELADADKMANNSSSQA